MSSSVVWIEILNESVLYDTHRTACHMAHKYSNTLTLAAVDWRWLKSYRVHKHYFV